MAPANSEKVSTDCGKDDLLSFQISHFGDDIKPDTFFVDPEKALNYQPDLDNVDDDDLGYYQDGVKRTLTDEQIEMFRHTELQQLLRKQQLEAEERALDEDEDDDFYEPTLPGGPAPVRGSPLSDASSLEAELRPQSTTTKPKRSKKSKRRSQKNGSRSARARSWQPPRSPRSRHRESEIPYDQRNKRNWEEFIDGNDPRHGSMTHRRLVRELDQQHDQDVAMDYGEDGPLPGVASTATGPESGRRIISYEDD